MRQGLEGMFAALVGWLLSRLTFGALPPFAAASAVIERDGKILVIERADGLGLNLPGGFLRWDETIEEGLRREVREETGYEIAIGRLIGIYSGPSRAQRLSSVVVSHVATIVGGAERDSFEGAVHWVTPADLFGRMAFLNEDALVDFLKQERLRRPLDASRSR